MFNPTPMQRSAIETKGSVLVTAAAGSGKTAVLVERVVRMLTSENPSSIDRLLIVTFTNAAAAEMRQRIEKRLSEEYEKNPSNRYIARQLMLLPSAQICTIDTFCINLVRENFECFAVSPDFKITDKTVLMPLYDKAAREVIDEYYDLDRERIGALLAALNCTYGDSKLAEAIFSIFEYSRNLPFPDEWFAYCRELYDDSQKSLALWRDATLHQPIAELYLAKKSIDEALGLIEENEKLVKTCKEKLTALKSKCDEICACLDSDKDKAFALCSNLSAPAFNLRGNDDVTTFVRTARQNLLSAAENYIGAYVKSDFEELKDVDRVAPYIKLLVEMTERFSNRLLSLMNEKNMLTFYNTEQMALELLCERKDEEYLMSSKALELFSSFDEILVDEYQDVNDLQDTLFSLLSGMGKKLFAVGDVKQSIYGFRGANPDNFINKKLIYVPIEEAKEDDKKKIVLSSNFRSRSGICGFVNYFCDSIMSRELGGVEYNEEEILNSAASFEETDEPDVEMHIISGDEGDDDTPIIEAKHIAAYIKRTVESKKQFLRGKDSLRAATYKDFAILLRSPGAHSDVYMTELQRAGIPARFDTGGFVESVEISTILSLLKVINNPTHDVPLLSLMMSPLFAFSAEDVAKIRLCDKKASIYGALISAANNGDTRAQNMLSRLHYFRRGAVTRSTEQLISWLFDETGLLDFVSAMEDGERRRNNLLLLMDYARNYDDGKNIRGFVAYIEKIGSTIKTAAGIGGDDAVNIVSFHGSKGLQYPICIIAGAFRKFNNEDIKKPLVMDRKLGIALKVADEKNNCYVNTVAREAVVRSIKKRTLSEELRVMYVAMTRAEEKLVVLLTSKNPQKRAATVAEKILSGNPLSALFDVSGYFDWFMYSLLCNAQCEQLRNVLGVEIPQTLQRDFDGCDISVQFTTLSEEYEQTEKVNQNTDTIDRQEILNRFNFEYPYKAAQKIKSKTSVSDIVHQNSTDNDFKARPAFASKAGLTPAERGTATHKFMQFADFSAASINVETELQRLTEKEFITKQEAQAVNVEEIGKFFLSELFSRMRESLDLHREMRFLTEISQSSELSQEKTVVQGIIDCVMEESDGLTVIDFKTDRVNNEEQLKTAYAKQLEIYADACEKMFGRKVKEKLIYSFALSKTIKV